MNQNHLIKHSRTWDLSGVFITLLCLVHCLFLPILGTLLPIQNLFHRQSWIEVFLFILAIFVGFFSLVTSFRQHRKVYPIILGLSGLVFLLASLVNELIVKTDLHPQGDSLWKDLNPLAIFGGSLLISGHLWNLHICHCFCNSKCIHKENQT